ncbi:MAG: hypothetical protein WA949_06805 [Phormidesmis sp.]
MQGLRGFGDWLKLAGVLERADKATKTKLETVKLAAVFERQLQKSEAVSLMKARAKKTLTQLRNTGCMVCLDFKNLKVPLRPNGQETEFVLLALLLLRIKN